MVNRRNFIKQTSIASVALSTGQLHSASSKKPNIILFMTDDIGMEWFGAYGNAEELTPNLDDLANKGMHFKHCYSQPICTPSRVKIMTGRYAFRNYKGFGHLAKTEITFGNILKDKGYKTCVVGKWQLAEYPSKDSSLGTGMTPVDAGFDEYCNWSLNSGGSRYADPNLVTNGENKTHEGKYGPDIVSNFALDFISRNKDKPFFCYYPMILTHSPFEPTPDSENKNSEDKKQNFRDMTAYTDKIVGKFIDQLKKYKILDNTLIMFTSDNGTSSSINAKMKDGSTYKGGKGSMKNRGTHVPLICFWQGVTPEGKASNDLIDFSDFLPTIVEASGAKLPTDRKIDGQSFLPQLKGEKGKPREWAFCNYWNSGRTKLGERQWIRNQQYKLYHDGTFFDIKKDLEEENSIPRGKGTEYVETQRKKLQQAFNKLAPKIDTSFDYSKKTEYKKEYKAAREAAIEKHKTDPELKSLVEESTKLIKERYTLAESLPQCRGKSEKDIQKLIDKNKLKKEPGMAPLKNKIDELEKKIVKILRRKDDRFAEACKIQEKMSLVGKGGTKANEKKTGRKNKKNKQSGRKK